MTHSLRCAETEALSNSRPVARLKNIERMSRRELLQLRAASLLASLRVPPGNQLEPLKAKRRGQHSLRINDRWRVCFVRQDGDAQQVKIFDCR